MPANYIYSTPLHLSNTPRY